MQAIIKKNPRPETNNVPTSVLESTDGLSSDLQSTTPQRGFVCRWLTRLLRWSLMLLAFSGLLLSVLYYLACQKPEFYQHAMAMTEAQAIQEGESLEIALLYLRNDVLEQESWIAEFSQDQINGWLASDMTRKFPGTLPPPLSNPRVAIEPSKLRFAINATTDQIDTVLSVEVDIFTTDLPQQFGVRILGVRAGWVPIPVSLVIQRATEVLGTKDIRVTWNNDEAGNPVAYVTVPPKTLSYGGRQIRVEQLEIADGSIRLAGTSTAIGTDD